MSLLPEDIADVVEADRDVLLAAELAGELQRLSEPVQCRLPIPLRDEGLADVDQAADDELLVADLLGNGKGALEVLSRLDRVPSLLYTLPMALSTMP